jgi:hypothetical protein
VETDKDRPASDDGGFQHLSAGQRLLGLIYHAGTNGVYSTRSLLGIKTPAD